MFKKYLISKKVTEKETFLVTCSLLCINDFYYLENSRPFLPITLYSLHSKEVFQFHMLSFIITIYLKKSKVLYAIYQTDTNSIGILLINRVYLEA